MKYFSKLDIVNTPKIERLNIINSVTGIKPANLIGTISDEGNENLAIISSVVHVGSNPALIGFIMRPTGQVKRHTYQNIKQTDAFTINHVPVGMIEQAHYTSAKFELNNSEFDECGFTPVYKAGFSAPFVDESPVHMGLKLVEEIPIKSNGCMFIIGQIEHLFIQEEAITKEGYINLTQTKTAGVGGLNTYYSMNKLASFPYARVEEVPNF